MNFGNNIEAMAFDKSGWSLVETQEDGLIYMGKPKIPDAGEDDPVWFIKRIETIERDFGGQTIVTKYAEGWNNKWSDRSKLTYKYF